jgi:hypothetical protein
MDAGRWAYTMRFSWKRLAIVSGGVLLLLVCIVVFVLTPTFRLFHFPHSPDWADWFVRPIFHLHTSICNALCIDWISEAANPWHYGSVFVFSITAYFLPVALVAGGIVEWLLLRLAGRQTRGGVPRDDT